MNRPELYIKLKLRPGAAKAYQVCAARIVQLASLDRNCLRSDWFLHDAKQEAIGMLVFADPATLHAHVRAAQREYIELATLGSSQIEQLCNARALPFDIAGVEPNALKFFSGIDEHSGASKFNREISATQSGHIEIYTKFQIRPEHLQKFRETTTELLGIVRERDPGSSRYDWFFDDARLLCVALDTYASANSMFAHMKNCHDVHARLLEYSAMVTEFLGELPAEAMQAVAKYDPYVIKFLIGLKPYSSGGFT